MCMFGEGKEKEDGEGGSTLLCLIEANSLHDGSMCISPYLV